MLNGLARSAGGYLPFRELTRSIRVRLTLWYVSLLALVLVAFAVGVYFFLLASISSEVSLAQRSYQRLLTASASQSPNQLRHFKLSRGSSLLGQLALYYQGVDPENQPQFHVGPLQNLNQSVAEDDVIRVLMNPKKQGCHQFEGSHFACTWVIYNRRHIVMGAVDFQASQSGLARAEDALRSGLLVGIPLSLLIALGGGWILASRALSPVEQLRLMAQSITGTDLSRRIGLRRDDELGRLAETLDEMIGGLDSAFKEQRRLTADVSHELRTPLSVIQAQTSLALKRERSPEEYVQVLSSIQEESQRMSKIVEDLLLLARAEAGQEALEHDPVRLDVTARWASEQLRPMAEDKEVELCVSVHPVMIEGDPNRLRQLALNLIHNAIKYTSAGGRVKVHVYNKDRNAVLQVVDTGKGIDENSLPHIFERFFMVDRSRARAEGSSGLGLSIVHWIVEAHGGTIEVDSILGKGTTFTVKIPLNSFDDTGASEHSLLSRPAHSAMPLPSVLS